MKIRKGDTVVVVSGASKGTRGTVLSVDRKNGKVVVEGVAMVYRHVRRNHPKSPQGGRLHVEMPIDASNVMLVDPESNKPTRVGVRVNDQGARELYAKRSGATIRALSSAKNQ